MTHSESLQNEQQWSSYLLSSDLSPSFLKQLAIFLERFEIEWAKIFIDSSYNLCQLQGGNRLRPLIAFLGYLISENDNQLSDDEYNRIVRASISIELIHKASLIMDDLVDGDSLRHGKATFHIVNGEEKAIAVGLYMMNKALKLLMETMRCTNVTNDISLRCLEISINTLNDMCCGLVSELSMSREDFSNIKLAEEIIRCEVSSIIKNSFIIGYLLRGGDKYPIINRLGEIGELCGFIFQVLNDMEPYENGAHYNNHKGKSDLEFFYDRKNYVTAFMLQLMSNREKEDFYLINDKTKATEQLFKYFGDNKISDYLTNEVQKKKIELMSKINEFGGDGVNSHWCINCECFINSLIEVALSRLA